MNQEQAISIVRQLLLAIGGGLISRGYVDGGTWELLASGLATVVVAGGWALWSRRDRAIVAAAAKVPFVREIQVPARLADLIPGEKVVPADTGVKL